MEVQIIQIGNSKGIRLSKALIESYNLRDKIELIPQKGYIILRAKTNPREGWDEAFRQMHENGDDKLLIPDVFEDEEFEI
jgi:antitoxin MazE